MYFQRYFSELISKSWWNMMVYAEKIGKKGDSVNKEAFNFLDK